MNKQGELLPGSKRRSPGKRIISTLLVLCMLFGLLPASVLAADTTASSGAASAGSDAFGIATKGDLTKEEKEAEAKSNPYGTENWFNLFPVSELHIAKGDSSGRSFDTHNYNKDGAVGSIGDAATGDTSIGYKNENQGNDGFRMMDTAGCDALGEGQKRYVATIAFWEGGNTIQLFLADQNGNRVSNVHEIGNSNTVEYLEAVEAHQTAGFLSVACGDFDGDGKDSIVAYFPEMEDGNPYICSYSIAQSKDGSFELTVGAAVESGLWGMLGTADLSAKNSKNSKVRNNTPLVQLVADDTDKDGVDELVVTTSISSTSANDVNNRGSRLFVYDYCANKDKAYTWNRSASMVLQAEGNAWAAGRLRWASSSVGNVIQNTGGGADFPEIVSAGYYDHTKDTSTEISDSDSKTNLAVYIASCTKVTTDQNGNQIGSYAQTATNLPITASGFVRGGLYTGDDVQSLVPVQAFAARGVNYADYILVADTVYSYENGALSEKYRAGYFNDDDDGIGACIITNGLVQDVTAGNFDGNVNGVEQVLFTTMQKRSGRNDYFSKIYTYQLNNSFNSSGKLVGEELWQKDETGYLTDCTGNAYLSLCAFDCDSDGTIVKYKEVSRTYTDPEVLALLEATPYFSEKDGGDTGNSATSYGTSKESGGSSSYSNSLTTNVVAGFEWGVDDITAGFACGAGFEATVENNFTWSTEEEQYESYSLTYSNDTGDNMVIVYRRPVITYCYEEKSTGKLHTVSKEGTLATSMIPVDRYNEIAAQNGMDLISDSVLSTPGDPFSYRSILPEGAVTKDSDKQQYSGEGTVEQSFTKGSTTTHSYEYELNTSFNAYGLVFGVKAGGGAGYAHTESTSTMNTTEITKAGAVTCNGTEEYDFQWQFAYWDTEVNGNRVPVLGYVVTDPSAPPSPPSNLSADEITPDSFKLNWMAGSRPADEYRIYRVLDDTGAEPVQVATVDGTETACTLSSLRADTTYTYIVKAYAAQGEGISSRGLSVASESLTITTPPEDAEAPTITGPDDVGARVGGTASFTVNVVLPDKYGSVSYQWQQRKNASGWSKVSDSSIGKTLKLTNVTEEMDGTEYRCALTASYADGSPTYYYSGVGKLTVGRTSVSAALGITGYATGNGDGSIAVPYTGAANYQMQNGTKTTEVLAEQPVTMQASGSIPELTVYQVNKSNPAQYVGIGTADGETVYYAVTKPESTYVVGAKLDLTQYEYLKIDKSAYDTMPTFNSTKPVSTEKDGVTYLLMATVAGGTTNPPITIPDGSIAKDTRLTGFGKNPGLTLHWYSGGKYYAYNAGNIGTEKTGVTGAYDVYRNDTGAYVLGRSETYTVESTEGTKAIYEDETGYWFYHVTMSETGNRVTCVQQSAKEMLTGDVPLSALTAVTKQEKTIVKVPVYETKDGTPLSLTATVTASTGPASGATVDFRIVNTSTGATATVTATTSSNGKTTASWTAPATGLYSVRAVVQDAGGYAGTESAPQYYYAGATAPSETDAIKEYQLQLTSGSTPLAGEMDYAADSVIGIATSSRTVSKGSTGDWNPITEGIVYTVTAPDGKTSMLSGTTAFTPSRAGVFSIKAYADTVATENLLAAVTLQVRRVSVTVKPTWVEGTIPASLSEISKSVSGATIDSALLDRVFKASCDLYGSGGSLISGKSGRFTVSLAYQNNDAAKNFTNCYSVNLQSDVLIVQPNSASVYYEWGENGTMQGRYGENHYTMSSGRSTIAGTELQFTATPNAGYQVDQWIINGTAMNKTAPEGYTLIGNTLTISSFTLDRDTVVAGEGQAKSLTVQVTFASSKNEITFGVTGDGGTLSAVSGSAPLTNGNSVALGATVTFTATPATNKVVDHWRVDGKTYTWPGTAETYRGSTLELKNISASHEVYVSFVDGASYRVTTSVHNEAGNAQPTLAAITAVNAETGVAVDLTQPIFSGTAMTFTATLTSPTTSTVKEWQYKTGTGSFVTVAGSGGQKSFTFYHLSSHTEVRAIVTSAQSFPLDFGILLDNKACTDNTIASLTAKSNGTPVTAGSQPAYIPVDFALTLSDNYRVVEWSNNVTANAADNRSASLASLLGTTGKITVTIEEKPQVTVAADENGTTTVSSTLMANNDQTIAEGETKHVENGSAISVTATPDKGWYVDSITIGSEKVFDEAATNYVPGAKTVQKSNITANTTVTVAYAPKPTVTITGDDHIDVTTQTDITAGYVEKYSAPITFTATPATGYETNVWTVNDNKVSPQTTTSDETTYTYPAGAAKVTENITVSVTSKAIPQYSISYAVVDTENKTDGGDGFNGKVSLAASRKDMDAYKVTGGAATDATPVVKTIYGDSTLTLTAAANEGYRVKHWLVDGEIYTKSSLTYSGTALKLEGLSAAKTVQVEFEKSTDQTTVSATEGGHIVSAKVSGTTVDVSGFKLSNDATVDIVAAADDGYELVGWTVNGETQPGATELSFSFTSSSSSTGSDIVAVFASDRYAVTYEVNGGNGTLAADFGDSGTPVKGGTSVTFTASPTENYAVESWTVNNAPQTETSNQLTLPITEATHVTVEFARSRYVVTFDEAAISATVGGQTIQSGAAVAKGSDVAFTAQLTGTNIVKNWTTNDVSDGGTTDAPSEQTVYTLTNLSADTTVSVETMENPSYEISYSAGAHGSISIPDDQQAASPVTALRHSKLTFAAAPEAYYQVDAWTVNGTAVTRDNAKSLGVSLAPGKDGVSLLTVNDLTANMTITVSFKEAVRYNVKFSADTTKPAGTIAATSNGQAIINTGIDLIGGSTLVFTATPTYSGDTNNATMVYHWTVNGKPVENNLSNQLELTLAETTNVVVSFEAYVGYAIPVSQPGYKISDVVRTPDDTKPTTQIRKGGTVSFQVSPDGALEYSILTKLTVSGYDCLTGTGNCAGKAEKVEAVRKADGSYKVTVTGVKGDITTEIEARKLVVGDITVPEDLKDNEELDTKEELQTKLNVQLTGVGTDNRAYYDIALKYWKNDQWVNVEAENFPESGVDVLLGYPTGTDKTNTFTIVHMFTTNSTTHKVGDTEVISNYQRTDEGILFHVSSLSPFALGWATSGGNPGGGGGDGGDGNPGGGGGTAAAVKYTLTFQTNGGSEIKSASAEAGTVIELAEYRPVREGYSFVGWYSDAALTQKITTVTLKKSVTIYAKWTEGSGVDKYLNTDDHIAYLSGYNTGEFGADNNMTRAEVAVMFYRLLKDQNAGNAKSFPDVDGTAWYGAAVERLAGLGIISGYSDGSFRPRNTITRVEFVAIASRFAKLTDADCSFSDVPKTHWAYDYIAFASSQGWISGYSDGTFGPSKNITRAEVTKIVNSMLGRQPDETYIDSHSVQSFADLAKTHWAYYEIMEAANAHAYTKSDDGQETWSALK